MWLFSCSKAGLHMPSATSPSLSDTLDPPSALICADTGKLMKENTDRPAFDTCAATGIQSTEHKSQNTMFLRIATIPQLKSAANLQLFFELCKQNKEYLQNFTNLFVYVKKNYYLCSRIGCKGATHVRVRVHSNRKKKGTKTMARPIAETPILYGEDALRFMQRAQYVESMSEKQRQANLRALEERLAQSKHKIEFCL